jgi:hypothetical protein
LIGIRVAELGFRNPPSVSPAFTVRAQRARRHRAPRLMSAMMSFCQSVRLERIQI